MRGTGRALRMAYLVASVAGVAFFVMSVTLLGVWPGRVLERQIRAMSPPHALGLTDSERRGRAIYGREGCAYCHTQQIRFVAADVARFGAPTLAWETRFDYPHLWGTRRIGPDLARAGSTRSEDWHFVHLYSPRAVVADSVMPPYPSLFDGAPDRPRQSARDLLAYLESLGRAREVAWPEGDAAARRACRDCPHDEMSHLAFSAPSLNASPARSLRGGSVPARPTVPEQEMAADDSRGRLLYARRCASCHGTSGLGDGPAAAGLRPHPTNLAEREYTRARIADVLWNGVPGTAMPAWRDHAETDLAAIAAAVLALRPARAPHAEDAPPPGLVELGQRVYEANCTQCHGAGGAGDGFAASKLRMAPTDFRRQRPSLAASLRALRLGIAGTPMTPWTGRLSDTEMIAVSHHVRALFQPDPDSGGR